METDPTHMCELLVGLLDVEVLGVERPEPGWLVVMVAAIESRPSCARCGIAAWVKDRRTVDLTDLPAFDQRVAVRVLRSGPVSTISTDQSRPNPSAHNSSAPALRPSVDAPRAIAEFMLTALIENPHRVGRPLQRELAGLHSARRGVYRIIYEIDETPTPSRSFASTTEPTPTGPSDREHHTSSANIRAHRRRSVRRTTSGPARSRPPQAS